MTAASVGTRAGTAPGAAHNGGEEQTHRRAGRAGRRGARRAGRGARTVVRAAPAQEALRQARRRLAPRPPVLLGRGGDAVVLGAWYRHAVLDCLPPAADRVARGAQAP